VNAERAGVRGDPQLVVADRHAGLLAIRPYRPVAFADLDGRGQDRDQWSSREPKAITSPRAAAGGVLATLGHEVSRPRRKQFERHRQAVRSPPQHDLVAAPDRTGSVL
jgi:hypothetical protein